MVARSWCVRHATRYTYDTPVELAAHMLHLRPRALPQQRILSHAVTAQPGGASRRDGTDHFGNHVSWLFLDSPHREFEVCSETVVEVTPGSLPPPQHTPRWEEVASAAADSAGVGGGAAEFLFDSPLVPLLPETRDYVLPSFPPGRPVLRGLQELNQRFRSDFAYSPGTTNVSTTVAQVMAGRAGVCQDFAQVMISGLRAIGLPARYVSGYIRTYVPPGQARQRGRDQSHAWVGCWMGPGLGWIDLDPTNALVVADEHVTVGWGRDFSDVSPVRGVILGGEGQSLQVSVDLDPLDATESGEEPG